jgi:hypothetical protein
VQAIDQIVASGALSGQTSLQLCNIPGPLRSLALAGLHINRAIAHPLIDIEAGDPAVDGRQVVRAGTDRGQWRQASGVGQTAFSISLEPGDLVLQHRRTSQLLAQAFATHRTAVRTRPFGAQTTDRYRSARADRSR